LAQANGVYFYIDMQIKDLYALFQIFPKISTDTRKDLKGSIFFCLSGENFNGNIFAAQALEKGASYVVIDNKKYLQEDSRYLLVKNSLETLQQLAFHHRKQINIPIIGITGSNGKTTTKELVTTVLSRKFKVTATQGNLNNHIGVPLTLLQINKHSEIAVVEMGANHADEIEFLCTLALPNYGIVTNIGKAHLEGFGSLEIIKRTKLALYKSVGKQKGKLFVNFDDPMLKAEAKNYASISYGEAVDFDVHGTISKESPFLELIWGIKDQENRHAIKSKLFGNYNISNIMAAISVGSHFGLSPEIISIALENYLPQNNRSQFIKGENNELILDSYNSNPDSLKVALANFTSDEHSNKAVILGDMFELGNFAYEEHKIILETLVESSFQLTILVGPLFKQFENEYPDFNFYENTAELLKHIQSLNQMRILIKGSRGVKLEILQDCLL